MIAYKTRQRIIAQALREISWARSAKEGKISSWQANEKLYYGNNEKKVQSYDGRTTDDNLDARANVDLGRMQEHVHTILSKVDSPIVFNFTKRKLSQLKRVERLNALRSIDSDNDNWVMKDIVGKKQCIIYGRAIYSYFADSQDGYNPHLENVDVYNFLIDPAAGGIDIEEAMYLGRYGVTRMRSDIEKGIKDGDYLRTEATLLLEGDGNSSESQKERINQKSRTQDLNINGSQKEIGNKDKFVFWQWCTTYGGKRYYLLLNESGGTAIRVEELKDNFKSNLYPFWTYAAFPDLTEFWTPGYCDYVRGIFMAQAVSINQMLDNSEQRNKPQKVVNVNAVKDLAQLKYQRGGNYIQVTGDGPVRNYIDFLEVPSIDTPVQVYNILEGIQEKSSGVTAGSKGVAEPDGKATIYEGNQAAAAGRYELFNKSYSNGYRRFAKLYIEGAKEHLTTKVAVDILGPDGVDMEWVSRKDLFKSGDDFKISVQASDAEMSMSELEKRTKIQFLQAQNGNPVQNPKKAYELSAQIAGLDDDMIKQLMDTSEFGDAELMSEAERDLECLLEGKDIKPNNSATNAYLQRFVDYMQDHQEDITDDQSRRIFAYMDSLEPIIDKNLQRSLSTRQLQQSMEQAGNGTAPSIAPPEVMIDQPSPINEIQPYV